MAAVAHGWHKPGGGGPPVSVAKDFNQADKGSSMLKHGLQHMPHKQHSRDGRSY